MPTMPGAGRRLRGLAPCRTGSPTPPARTCCSTPTTRSTGGRGRTRRSPRPRRRDVPVLLSVGYAACHWCHVMAHESFEDAGTAELINAQFVAIKVDREERPDVDAVYMAATQAMTGQGGWPMTCFLTPDGEPFHCGTYYPATPRAGMPSFRQLLDAVEPRPGGEDGARVRGAAGEIAARLADSTAAALPPAAARRRRAGPGGARRCATLRRAARRVRRRAEVPAVDGAGVPAAPARAHRLGRGAAPSSRCTAERMARGGIYDQLAGGFARYSVDAALGGAALREDALRQRAAAAGLRAPGPGHRDRRCRGGSPTETAAFLLRDLRTRRGRLRLGAGRRHRRGRGPDLRLDAGAAASRCSATTTARGPRSCWSSPRPGTFEHGTSTLQLPRDPDDPARWARVRERAAGRPRRPPAAGPRRQGGHRLERPGHHRAGRGRRRARRARTGSPPPRRRPSCCWTGTWSTAGCAGPPATAWSARRPACWRTTAAWPTGCSRCTRPPARRAGSTAASDAARPALAHFADAGRRRFYDTADDAEALVHRPRDPTDNADPVRRVGAGRRRCSPRRRWSAEPARVPGGGRGGAGAAGAAGRAVPAVRRPLAAPSPRRCCAGPLQVAVVGRRRRPARRCCGRGPPARPRRRGGRGRRRRTPPGCRCWPTARWSTVAAAAYVCRGFVCDRPVTTPDELAAQLGR